MISIRDNLKKIIEKDEKIKKENLHYIELVKERDECFKNIITSLNNHREEFRNEWGVPHYKYADICSVVDDDRCKDIDYSFKVSFIEMPSANELKIIEDISGCKFDGQHNIRSYISYFRLPKKVSYDRNRLGEYCNVI